MPDRQINASTFKARCLALLDEVAETGQPILVTKRGEPVARLLPVSDAPSLLGSVEFRVEDDELIAPLAEPWKASG